MEGEKFNIALIVLEVKERDFYKDLLSKYPDQVLEEYSTIHQFKRCCSGRLYSGILVDIRTLIRSTMPEREFFSMLWDGFPVLHVGQNPGNGDISCLMEGKHSTDLKGKQLLDHFIEVKCREVAPRQVRVYTRKKAFLNTLLYLSKDHDPIRTNSWDISEGGSFIITTAKMPDNGLVWLKINDFDDKKLICSKVKWKRPWGKDYRQLPGFGVEFEQVSNKQLLEIKELKKVS